MATVSSVSSLQISVALAERQVQRDQSQIQEDSAQLSQSQAQLDRDQRSLGTVQDESQRAVQSQLTAVVPTFARAIQALPGTGTTPTADTSTAAPAAPAVSDAATARPQLNAQGQTIGKLINVTA